MRLVDMARVAYSTTVEAKPGALDYLRDLKSAGAKMGPALLAPNRTVPRNHWNHWLLRCAEHSHSVRAFLDR